MRERVTWEADETLPSRPDVLELQGIRTGDDVPPRILTMLDVAMTRYLELAEPRAVVADIDGRNFAIVYQGDGRNAAESPLETIYPKAHRLALMAATVGPRVSRLVHDLFESHDMASGVMLDAVASSAAERLASLLAGRFVEEDAANIRALPYSPGYCGWHVSGQRALFHYLKPEDIGITLNASCLMQPLKSVSGVLVAGPPGIHRFRPTYSFCTPCDDKQCRERIASVLRPQSQERHP